MIFGLLFSLLLFLWAMLIAELAKPFTPQQNAAMKARTPEENNGRFVAGLMVLGAFIVFTISSLYGAWQYSFGS